MQTIERDDDVKRYRTLGAAVNAAILASVAAGIVTIAAQADDRQQVALNCAYEPAAVATVTDAVNELAGLCGSAAAGPTVPTTRYGVPEASAVLDPRAAPEPMAPTF